MRFFTFLVAGALFSFTAQGQKHCYTAEVHNKLIQVNPKLIKVDQQLEQFTQQYIAQRAQNRTMADAPVYVIPLVFHIIHNYGPEDISDDQVKDAVRILNLDFRKLNTDTGAVVSAFKSIAADCSIEFRLANVDPNGKCTNGIERIASSYTNNADDHSKLDPWPNDQYLNVWVVSSLSDGSASAYSYYPGQYPTPLVDGVIIIHSYLGSIGTGNDFVSRTLTHEIGHCLNLKHPWGDSNSPGVACGDDQVDDTPLTKGWAECNLSGLSCQGSVDNVQNYMEYSFCCNMFTQGQKARMLATLNSSTAGRNNLWTSSNLATTGANTAIASLCAPRADFAVNPTFICSGVAVQFKDLSWNGKPTSWTWSFPGGSPDSSHDSMPVIYYASPSPDAYNVTLTVGNAEGATTVTKLSAVTVSGLATNTIPYVESFENTSSFPGVDGFVINADDRTPAWLRTTSAGYSGTSSIMVNNFSSLAGQVDAYITPSFSLAHVSQPVLTFKVANAQRGSATNDMLKVYISMDCGATWIVRYSKAGSSLSTVGIVGTRFVPNSSSQWRTESINLSLFAGRSNLRIKFENTSGGGNNTYIDDININGVVGINEVSLAGLNFDIYPNPSNDRATISFDLPKEAHVNVLVRNMLGQTIRNVENGKLNAGNHHAEINTSHLARGIYFVDLMIDDSHLVKKLIVE